MNKIKLEIIYKTIVDTKILVTAAIRDTTEVMAETTM